MKDFFTFIIFVIYVTLIFFAPNKLLFILIPLIVNIIIMIIAKVNIKNAIKGLVYLLPLLIVTGIINWILEDFVYALYINIKLILGCNITYIYSKKTTAFTIAKTMGKLCIPLKIFKINTEDIEILVALALAMIPVLKKEFLELKTACIAKNIKWNIKNMKIILSKLFLSIIKRVNEIDEALIEKGHVA